MPIITINHMIMSKGDSYFYDKAERKDKSDEEKRSNNREADSVRGQISYNEARTRDKQGPSNFNEDLKRLDPKNDD